jgi:glycogen debranching enzyme
MTLQISIGPPILTINQNQTFMVTDLDGQIAPESEQGVFDRDTRFMSRYEVYVNGKPWVRLSSSATSHYSSLFYLTNPALATEEGEIPAGTIGLSISRALGDGLHEDLDITNYNLSSVRFNLQILFHSDFADLFEVKDHKFVSRGRMAAEQDLSKAEMRISYENRDFRRTMVYRVVESDSPARPVNGMITFDVELPSQGSWHACEHFSFHQGKEIRRPKYQCYFKEGETEVGRLQREWQERATKLTSSNEDVVRTYRQAVEDMGALRLFTYDWAPDVWLPSAGVPWFVTVFGRDSLIVSLQCAFVDSTFVQGALKTLAQFQATAIDPYRDAEPGKILHELRFGELAHFKKIPHTPYYGTAEATPLYLGAVNSAWRWTGDDSLLHEYREVALKGLKWIDRYGDLDDDGFQEYQTRSPKGYENMGWKDAGDAVVYPDGTQVKQPKALCELQAIVYDAWLRTAENFDRLGEPEKAADLRERAADLRKRFEESFWCEEIGSYAYGLDPGKKQIKTIVSNAGQCLTFGIASPEHAGRVVKRLMEPDMWSGWGIRTLSALNPAYNPFSYQNGSVWPHDNSLIALGFKRYGFAEEAARVAHDIFAAASYFSGYRLPELYAGIQRKPGTFPVQYLGANVPQAWAAGGVFLFLQVLLGLRPDAPHNRFYVNPTLPDWLPDVTLQDLKVGNSKLNLRFWREDDRTRWEVLSQDGDIKVEEVTFDPWSVKAEPVEKVAVAAGSRHKRG